jgi:hypothetical protein
MFRTCYVRMGKPSGRGSNPHFVNQDLPVLNTATRCEKTLWSPGMATLVSTPGINVDGFLIDSGGQV